MSVSSITIKTGQTIRLYVQVLKWASGSIGTSKLTGYTGLALGGANASDGQLTATAWHSAGATSLGVSEEADGLYYTDLDTTITNTAQTMHVTFNTAAPLAQQSAYHIVVYIGPAWINNLDAAISSRPTAAQNASAIWDELLSGHTTAGSAGARLTAAASSVTPADIADAVWDESLAAHNSSGSTGLFLQNADVATSTRSSGSTDILNTVVPASYASNTVGGLIGKLSGAGTSTQIVVTTPVAYGGSLSLIDGNDYLVATSAPITWEDTASYWPEMPTGTTAQFIVKNPRPGDTSLNSGNDFTQAVTIVDGTGAGKTLQLELTRTQVATLNALFKAGATSFKVNATLTGGVRTLIYSSLKVQD